jgi:hypothetical protein
VENEMCKVLIIGSGAGRVNLQLFANLDDVITANAAAFEGSSIKDQFSSISTKLGELGYDVLINNKKAAEFVPSGRLNDVVSQRDGFKTQVEGLQIELAKMKDAAKGNDQLQGQLQGLMDQNKKLLDDIEKTKVDTEIMLAAKEAANPKDILLFIDRNNIKVSAKGEILGVDSEIERLKKEKPYLFNASGKPGKGGTGAEDKGGTGVKSMNDMIRRAAGI